MAFLPKQVYEHMKSRSVGKNSEAWACCFTKHVWYVDSPGLRKELFSVSTVRQALVNTLHSIWVGSRRDHRKPYTLRLPEEEMELLS